jgi:hypothetical protein
MWGRMVEGLRLAGARLRTRRYRVTPQGAMGVGLGISLLGDAWSRVSALLAQGFEPVAIEYRPKGLWGLGWVFRYWGTHGRGSPPRWRKASNPSLSGYALRGYGCWDELGCQNLKSGAAFT